MIEPYAIYQQMTAHCQSKVIQTQDGPLTISWPKDKTFAEVAGEFLLDIYRLNKWQPAEKAPTLDAKGQRPTVDGGPTVVGT